MANFRVSNEQLDELLEYLAEHSSLVRGVGLGSRSKETVDRQWNDLAMKLNSFGSGSSKTGDRWKRYWADLKYKTKYRVSRRRQDAQGTGGGPSNQEDLSEVDKKVLAIIGERAVYGDSQHRVPVFNIQPEVPVDDVPVPPENMLVSEEVIISDTPEPVAGPSWLIDEPIQPQVLEPHQTGADNQPARNRPRLRHNRPSPTSNTTANTPEPVAGPSGLIDATLQPQQVPEPQQPEAESQPSTSRPRLRRNRPSLTSNSATTRLQTRIDPEWVMELERNRVQAENKMADATFMMAEAAKKIAEAAHIHAETSRKQLEIMNTLVDVVNRLSTVLAARDSH